MDEAWDSETLARNMLEILPGLRRLMAVQMRSLAENEATLMQLGALHMLMHHRMTTSDLAKKRSVSLQAASKFVQGLVERGWVVRIEDPNDRRRSILEVTAEGQAQEAELMNQMTTRLAEFFTELNQEEASAAQVFLRGLNRLIQEHGFVDHSTIGQEE